MYKFIDALIIENKKYQVYQQGGLFLIYDQNNQLSSVFRPCDNTLLICDPNSFALAETIGTKRFLVGNAAQTISIDKAIKFARDLTFSLDSHPDNSHLPFQTKRMDLKTLLEEQYKNKEAQFYALLTQLYKQCANYTPEKMVSYKDKTDIMARFNLDNNGYEKNVVTDHTFLLDDKNNIIGAISATIVMNHDGRVDVYFYDEVVNYFKLLNESQTKTIMENCIKLEKLNELIKNVSDDKTKNELEDKKINIQKENTAIIEPQRAKLLESLFINARLSVNECINKMRNYSFQEGPRNAFIRAAAGREELYKKLHCGLENTNIYVIHGPHAAYGEKLSQISTAWVEENFKEILQKLQNFAEITIDIPGSQAAILSQSRLYGKITPPSPSINKALLESPRVSKS